MLCALDIRTAKGIAKVRFRLQKHGLSDGWHSALSGAKASGRIEELPMVSIEGRQVPRLGCDGRVIDAGQMLSHGSSLPIKVTMQGGQRCDRTSDKTGQGLSIQSANGPVRSVKMGPRDRANGTTGCVVIDREEQIIGRNVNGQGALGVGPSDWFNWLGHGETPVRVKIRKNSPGRIPVNPLTKDYLLKINRREDNILSHWDIREYSRCIRIE